MPRRAFQALFAAVTAVCAMMPAGATAQTYQFGSTMILDTKLRMASFGPMRSVALDCSDADYACLKADYLAIAVPNHCASPEIAARKDYSVEGISFHVLGAVRYQGDWVTLVDVPRNKGFAFGYSLAGVRFVMIAPLARGRMLDLSRARAGRALQAAFERAQPYLLPSTGDLPMFACTDRR